MSRRSGQVGRVEQKRGAWRGRYLEDVPGRDRRVYRSRYIAPASGPGAINKSQAERRLMEIIAEAGINKDVTLLKYEAASLTTTFKEQGERWITSIQVRKRKPVKPHTVQTWKAALKRLCEQIGDIPLSAIRNRAVRDHVVRPMSEDGFAPKTISNDVGLIKMVVASAINDDGEELYPVKWDHNFMDLPDIGEQKTPTFSEAEVDQIIVSANDEHAVLYALLAGAGLRIGEALALKVEDVTGSTLRINKSLWNGILQSPKTINGKREVDIHSSLAVVLHSRIGNRTSGFVFSNRHTSNLLRKSLHPILAKIGHEPCGFHAFRRFRITRLRKEIPEKESMIRFWIGHANKSVTDGYDFVRQDREYRRLTAEQAGLGFTPPEVRKPSQSTEVEVDHVEAVRV
jgi:integrase